MADGRGIFESSSHFHLQPSLPASTQLPVYSSSSLSDLLAQARQSFRLFGSEQAGEIITQPETGHWSEEHILIKAAHRRSIALGSIPDMGMNVPFSLEVKNNQSVYYTTHQPPRETFLVTGLFSKCIKAANEERCQMFSTYRWLSRSSVLCSPTWANLQNQSFSGPLSSTARFFCCTATLRQVRAGSQGPLPHRP